MMETWNYRVMWRICFLISVLVSCCDGTGFNPSIRPPSIYYGTTGKAVSFEWGYTIDNGDEVSSIKCGYWNNTKLTGVAVFNSAKKVLEPVPIQVDQSLQNRVVVGSAGKALIIGNLKFSDERVFACQMVYLDGNFKPFVTASSNSSLIVQGQPSFCSSYDRNFNITENTRLPFDLLICANPKPSVAWKYGQVTTPQPDGDVVLVGKHTYKVSILTEPLTKYLCGTKLSCVATNRFLQESAYAMVYIEFTPDAPVTPNAYYKNATCVQTTWSKPNIGECSQSYYFDYYIKDSVHARRELLNTKLTTYSACFDDTGNENITSVNVIAFTPLGQKNASAIVSLPPPPPPGQQTSSSKVYIILGVVLAIIILTLLVATLCYFKKRKDHQNDRESNGRLTSKSSDNGHQMETKPAKQPTEVIYAEAQKGPVVYCELGSGGGRNPERGAPQSQSDYCEVKTHEQAEDELEAMVPPRRKTHRI